MSRLTILGILGLNFEPTEVGSLNELWLSLKYTILFEGSVWVETVVKHQPEQQRLYGTFSNASMNRI